MKKITLQKVLWALEGIQYKVTVPKEVRIKAKKSLERSEIAEILRDVRRSIYALESTSLSPDDAAHLVRKTRQAEILSRLEEVLNIPELEKTTYTLIRNEVRKLKGVELDQDRVNHFAEWLKEAVAKAPVIVWEVMQPVLSELIATGIKKQAGL